MRLYKIRQQDLSATVRFAEVATCVGARSAGWREVALATYKVATHRHAVNAARAYCLRSRDEPFSRARRRPVNRKGGGNGGNR
ncbi:unnamed protein product [Leptosia nina]|uniref:Uncharacterized protein n=1 Tax=Leptosia nina TaxID=320188 RepID=A0AAV1IYA8_9NEOP